MNIKPTLIIFLITGLICSSTPDLSAQWGPKISNSIDLILGVDMGFRIIDYNQTSQTGAREYQNRSEFETYKPNYRFGLNYVRGVSRSLSLKTGVRLSNPGFTISGVDDIDPTENINTIEKQLNTNRQGSDFKYGYQLIEIPLGLRYTLTKQTCEPFFEIGISTNLYWRTKIKRKRYNQSGFSTTIVHDKKIKKLNYVGFLSLGGNINLTPDFSGFTQLIARYQLNQLRESALSERIVSIGFECGIRRYIY